MDFFKDEQKQALINSWDTLNKVPSWEMPTFANLRKGKIWEKITIGLDTVFWKGHWNE